MSTTTFSNPSETHVEDMQLDNDGIRDVLHNVFHMYTRSVDEIEDGVNASQPLNEGPSMQQPTQVPNKMHKNSMICQKMLSNRFMMGAQILAYQLSCICIMFFGVLGLGAFLVAL